MASWRNIVPRKEHKERSQPIKRKRFGLLEKHKDYVKRARDYHSKQDRLTEMKRKASGKNPDEFYFGMKNAKTNKGVHVVEKERPDAGMTAEMQKLVSTQDLTCVVCPPPGSLRDARVGWVQVHPRTSRRPLDVSVRPPMLLGRPLRTPTRR
jgi:hypothetical protein